MNLIRDRGRDRGRAQGGDFGACSLKISLNAVGYTLCEALSL